ncbi:hypothetical protein HDU93_003447 [Gonapodya sp. JEL0774]|nr:hypothetical protein HDU93_003447 [Gonapodya sp. JEL0774]
MAQTPGCLEGITITTTGLGLEERTVLSERIEKLGGTASLSFTNIVTHLVAAVSDSDKYYAAVQRGIPVIRPSWIEECLEMRIHGGFDSEKVRAG